MKRLALVLGLAFVVGCANFQMPQRPIERANPTPKQEQRFVDRIAPALNATVHITSRTKEGVGLSMGSGVVIDHRLVLTAKHIVDHTGAYEFVVRHGTSFSVGKCIMRGKADDDWALLLLDKHVGTAIKLLDRGYRLELYSECLVVGHPAGLRSPTVTTGRIQEVLPRIIRISAPIWYGNSGGGMYVDVDGELRLAGLTVAMYGPTAHMGIVCHVDAMRK